MAAAALLGTGAAMAAAAGDGASMSANVPITIKGVSFKEGRGKTITINGVAFKKSARGQTLTINGTAFKGSARGQTLTINGTAFKGSARGQTLTINGTAFKGSARGQTLTINGVSFEGTPRTGTLPQTLTINGVAVKPNAPGPAGPAGPPGPPGPATTLAGPPPRENGGPIAVKTGAGAVILAGGATFSAVEPRRVLLTGGFSAACAGCNGAVEGTWELQRDGQTVVRRRFGTLAGDETAGVSLSEVVVAAGGEFRLVASATGGSGAAVQQIDVTDVRLGLVDLGAVSG